MEGKCTARVQIQFQCTFCRKWRPRKWRIGSCFPRKKLIQMSSEFGVAELITRTTSMMLMKFWTGTIRYAFRLSVHISYFWNQRADELGILIWQDFMFACALYPANPEYLDTVKKEVETQVKRLQHHACLGVWVSALDSKNSINMLNWLHSYRHHTLSRPQTMRTKEPYEIIGLERRTLSKYTKEITSSSTSTLSWIPHWSLTHLDNACRAHPQTESKRRTRAGSHKIRVTGNMETVSS